MDRAWMTLENRNTPEFINGVKDFIQFVVDNKDSASDWVYYPCRLCNNILKVEVQEL